MNGPISRPAKGMTIHLAEIAIPAGARPCNASTVAELARSIDAIGLQSAPTVVERDGRYVLVAGRHRIEALRRLGVESVLVRFVEFDDIEARLWTLSENLHRAELTALERSEAIAEYARLIEEKRGSRASAPDLSAQLAQKAPYRPEGGDSLAAREIGVPRDEVRRARAIAALPEETKRAAIDRGLEDNQAALLRIAKAPTPELQRRAIETDAARPTALATPGVKPLRNLENISGGELARWIKISTPNDRPHVIRVLEMAAAILRDELARPEAASPQNCALDGVSEASSPPTSPSDKSPPAAPVGPARPAGAPKGRIRI